MPNCGTGHDPLTVVVLFIFSGMAGGTPINPARFGRWQRLKTVARPSLPNKAVMSAVQTLKADCDTSGSMSAGHLPQNLTPK